MSIFIGICGGTGSGKSTLATRLQEEIGAEQSTTITFDSYYHGLDQQIASDPKDINFDHPNSVDVSRLCQDLDDLSQGIEVAVPDYDFKTHSRTQSINLVEPKPIIILEGILLFAFESIRNRMDYLVFRDCPEQIRFERRRERDIAERGRTPESVRDQFYKSVKPMHDLFVQPFKHKADYITLHNSNIEETVAKILFNLDTLDNKNHVSEGLELPV